MKSKWIKIYALSSFLLYTVFILAILLVINLHRVPYATEIVFYDVILGITMLFLIGLIFLVLRYNFRNYADNVHTISTLSPQRINCTKMLVVREEENSANLEVIPDRLESSADQIDLLEHPSKLSFSYMVESDLPSYNQTV